MFQLNFEIMGDEQVRRGFSRFADGVRDLSDPFREIVQDFREIEKKQFASQGGYGSGGWKPLKESTLRQKQRRGYPAQILVASGELRDVMTGLRPGYEEVQPLTMKIMTLSFGKYHQRGTSKMDARPLVQLTEEDKTRWTKIIQRYLVGLARKEFAGLMPDIGAGRAHLKAIQKE